MQKSYQTHRLVELAKREGVSLNTLAVSLLAEGLRNRSSVNNKKIA